MTNYSQASSTATKGARKPPRRIVLKGTAFADTWSEKPDSDSSVAIGLRLISAADVQHAAANADAMAKKLYTDTRATGGITSEEGLVQERNEALMRFCVARACCDVNDVTRNFFTVGEEQVRCTLTNEAISQIWDELLILHALSATHVEAAKDDRIARLARILLDTRPLAAMGESGAIEVRKLLGHCLAMLEGTGHPSLAEDTDEEDAYVVQVRQ